MRAYLTKRHFLKDQKIINQIKRIQKEIFEEGKSAAEIIADATAKTLRIYKKIRKIIGTDNIIQIESINDDEITVAEFDAFYKSEIILFISEDDLGNKYIEVSETAINQDGKHNGKKYKTSLIHEHHTESVFYNESNEEVSPEMNFLEGLINE